MMLTVTLIIAYFTIFFLGRLGAVARIGQAQHWLWFHEEMWNRIRNTDYVPGYEDIGRQDPKSPIFNTKEYRAVAEEFNKMQDMHRDLAIHYRNVMRAEVENFIGR